MYIFIKRKHKCIRKFTRHRHSVFAMTLRGIMVRHEDETKLENYRGFFKEQLQKYIMKEGVEK